MFELVDKLKELGFNSYEAKVYIALLKKYPATGYEISQLADIPQSRAYDALKSLAASKAAFADDNKPQRFSPVSPKELIKQFKRKMNAAADYLEKKLPDVKSDYNDPIHYISGYETVLNKLKEVIQSAKSSLYLEIWSDDFKHLDKFVTDAYDRGVDVKIVGYNSINYPFGLVYNHSGGKEIQYHSGRQVYLLSDGQESVFGKIESQVIWTKNKDITFLVKEFIVHDMYLLDVNNQFPEQLKYFYGTGFKKLKEKILTKDSDFNIH